MPATIPVHPAAQVAAVLAVTVLVTTVLVAVVLVGKVLVDPVVVKITMTVRTYQVDCYMYFSVKADFTSNLQTKVEFKQASKL